MKFENYEQFKNQSKLVQGALNLKLKNKGEKLIISLSMVQEALAIANGFPCLAAYKASEFKTYDQIVSQLPDNLGTFLLCVEGLAYDAEMEPQSFAIVDPEYRSIRDISITKSHIAHREFRSEGYLVDSYPDLNEAFWSKCYVSAVYIECPSIGEYGVPYLGDELTAAQRIAKQFTMNVLAFPSVHIYDRGDDGGTTVFFEVHAPQEVFSKLETLTLTDHDGDPV